MQLKNGTPIVATISGIVTYVGFNGSGGYSVIIEGDNGFSSMYCHVSPTFLVYVDQKVSAGSVVAMVRTKKCIWSL